MKAVRLRNLFYSLFLLFFGYQALAQAKNTDSDPIITKTDLEFFGKASEVNKFNLADLVKDSTITLRWQIDGDKNENITVNGLLIRPRLNITIPLSNKLKFKLEAQTGQTYSSGWGRLVTFDGTDENFPKDFRVRRIYFDYDLSENAKVQYGALQSNTPWSQNRPFSLDTDGWIDGLRASFKNVYRRIDQIHITLGMLDPRQSPNAFDRNLNAFEADFIQISIAGEIDPRLNYVLEANHLGSVDESFTRLDLDLKVDDWARKIIDRVRSEFVVDLETGRLVAASSGLVKNIGPLSLEFGALKQNRSETQRLLNNGIYRELGNAIYGTLQYQFKDKSWRLTQRCRVCVDESTCNSKFRCDTSVEKKF